MSSFQLRRRLAAIAAVSLAPVILAAGCARGTHVVAPAPEPEPAPEPAAVPVPTPAAAPAAWPAPRPEALAPATPEEVGMDPAALTAIDSIILAAIADSTAPGAALAIGRHGRLVRLQGYGRLDWSITSAPVNDSSIYDLASLTKVVGTTTATMILFEEGRIELDAPVARYLEEWRNRPDRAAITVRHLLSHSAGLPAGAPLYRLAPDRDSALTIVLNTPLQYEPGTASIYSDFSMILMALVVERVAGMPLDRFLDQRVFRPLGMRDTGFRPRTWGPDTGLVRFPGGDPAILSRIAPTSIDTVHRKTHIHADVHDSNAFRLGGVAGHAGLFSSARDLAVFAQFLLNGGSYAGITLLQPATVRAFTATQNSYSSRALGWDTPSKESSSGDYASPSAFGHTGFTGTSIWIDPERDLFIILLTNRVNPTSNNPKIFPLRRAIADAAQLGITDLPPPPRRFGPV